MMLLRCLGTDFSRFLPPAAVELQQVRGRKRNLKAGLTRAQKMERRLKREAKIAARKQYSFMQRIHIRRMKSMCVRKLAGKHGQ